MSEEKQKTALITGANRGLGLGTARALAKQGIRVLLGVRQEKAGREAEEKLKGEGLDAEFVRLDLGDAGTHKSVAKYIEERFGKLDILVNNAAVHLEGAAGGDEALNTPVEIYRQTFEVNLFNLIELTQTLLPLIRKSEAGRIVNLSSALASNALHSDPNSPIYDLKYPAYDISKSAVNAYTVHLSYKLKDTPIKVNAADPGWVKTDMGGENAPLEIEDGIKTPVALATLPADGFTGKFIHLGKELPW